MCVNPGTRESDHGYSSYVVVFLKYAKQAVAVESFQWQLSVTQDKSLSELAKGECLFNSGCEYLRFATRLVFC